VRPRQPYVDGAGQQGNWSEAISNGPKETSFEGWPTFIVQLQNGLTTKTGRLV